MNMKINKIAVTHDMTPDYQATAICDLKRKMQELDSELCQIIVDIPEGSDADKWLEAAHDHLGQATHRLERAAKCLSITATKS